MLFRSACPTLFREERPWQASHTGVSQASSPGLASPVSSSSSIANLSPGPSPTQGGENKAHTKSPHPHNFGGRGLTRRLVVPPPFAPLRITDAEPLLCALTGASRRRLLTARNHALTRVHRVALGGLPGLARVGARSIRAALCIAGDNRTFPITAVWRHCITPRGSYQAGASALLACWTEKRRCASTWLTGTHSIRASGRRRARGGIGV